jgi:hypothetical protein
LGWGREFSWEWTSIPATFLALGLVRIGTHSVRRLAILRAFAMLLSGTVVLVLDVVRVRPVHGSAESYTPPYVGCSIVGAFTVGLLILGARALRFALMKTNGDADAQAMKFLGHKLHSLWESALSLCVGSRVKGASSNLTGDNPNDAPLGGTALGEEPVSHDANLPAMTPEPDPVGGSALMPGTPRVMLEKAKNRKVVVVVRGRGNETRKQRYSARAVLPGVEKAKKRMEPGRQPF